MHLWIGLEYLSSVFIQIESWFASIFNAIMENGFLSFLTVMSLIVILFWIIRMAGGSVGAGSDAVRDTNNKDHENYVKALERENDMLIQDFVRRRLNK